MAGVLGAPPARVVRRESPRAAGRRRLGRSEEAAGRDEAARARWA